MKCIIAYNYIETMNKIASISIFSLHFGEFIIGFVNLYILINQPVFDVTFDRLLFAFLLF
jgi:hypothetical protein